MNITDLKGIITPVVTVFSDDDSIDTDGYRSIINHLVEHDVAAIFTSGGQGEGFALSVAEKRQCLDICLETVNGRVPVLAGTGAITTRDAVSLTRDAAEAGADAAVLITPHFISPNQNELYDYYRAVLDATDIPVMIYNNPWRTHVSITPETVARLCEYSPNISGIKDSSGDLALTLGYKRLCPESFKVYIGRDQLILSGLLSGLDGAVAATSNAAIDIVTGIYRAFCAQDMDEAKILQERLIPLREFFARGTFPVVVKEAMTMQGLAAGRCRAPVSPLDEHTRADLRDVLTQMGLTLTS